MFHLESHQATLANVSFYTEKHGDDAVHGVALKFESSIASEQLTLFHKGLADFIFKGQVPRFQEMGPIPWEHALIGATVEIDADDLTGARRVRLLADVDKFVFSPTTGGAVEITFRVKCHPDAEDVATLYELQQRDILLSVEPPKAGASVREFDLLDKSAAA